MARFILVHGAFAGAWTWDRVVPELRARGHEVTAIDLPGSGDDTTPVAEVTLDAYEGKVCEVLAAGSEPAVLCGHSMGGMVVTQAAARAPEHIAKLVYVCGFLPQDGQSLKALTELPEGAADQVQANLIVEGDPPVGRLEPAAARDALFTCCDEETAAWALSRRRPNAVAPFVAPVSIGGEAFDAIPRAYVVCSRDRAIPPELQRRMLNAQGITEVVDLDTDHAPFFSATAELVDALHAFASTAAPVP